MHTHRISKYGKKLLLFFYVVTVLFCVSHLFEKLTSQNFTISVIFEIAFLVLGIGGQTYIYLSSIVKILINDESIQLLSKINTIIIPINDIASFDEGFDDLTIKTPYKSIMVTDKITNKFELKNRIKSVNPDCKFTESYKKR